MECTVCSRKIFNKRKKGSEKNLKCDVDENDLFKKTIINTVIEDKNTNLDLKTNRLTSTLNLTNEVVRITCTKVL